VGALVAFDVFLDTAKSASDCPQLDPALYGVNNVDAYLQQNSWQIGLGQMSSQMESTLSSAFQAAGLDWANDWDPFVFTQYVGMNGMPLLENGYVEGYLLDPNECYWLNVDANGVPVDGLEPLGNLSNNQIWDELNGAWHYINASAAGVFAM
jgi:hypothetical protein